MTTYRDLLCERLDHEIGSVVGVGLDRLERTLSQNEMNLAIKYFHVNKSELIKLPLSGWRGRIAGLFTMPVNYYLLHS